MKRKEGIFPELQQDLEDQTAEANARNLSLRLRVWNILENPGTSNSAWYFGMTSLLIVWLSIVSASVETLPSVSSLHHVWDNVELSLNVWFLVELVLRFAFNESAVYFLKQTMNVIDMFAILPYFIMLAVGGNVSVFTV